MNVLRSITDFLADYGVVGVMLLALIDSAGVPLPVGMDALLILTAAKRPHLAWWCATLAVLGSVAGNVVLFLAARRGGRRFVEHTPAPGSTSRFRRWFNRYGLVTVFIPALVPVPLPLKIFVVSAGALRLKLTHFLWVVLAARIIRYAGEAYVGIKLGEESTDFLQKNAWTLVGAALGLAMLLYVLIRLSDRFRRPPTEMA